MKKIFKILLWIFLILTIIFITFTGYVYFEVKRNFPIEVLQSYEPIKPSSIYDINGKMIDSITIEKRDPISINELPEHVKNAFIAVEDKRFYNHNGLDYLRLTKALMMNLTGTGRQGGSTITQQLVKTAFLTPERSIKRKVREAVLATEMERIFTKDEILEKYLNTINFGRGVYGIKNASLRYFGVLPKDLTIAQAATLAGMPKSPSKYSKLENAVKRQKIVLNSMYKGNFITEQEYEEAKNEKIEFISNEQLSKITEAQGITNSNIAPEMTTIVIDEVQKIFGLEEDEVSSIFDGFKIYTTIDLDMQRAAYKAIKSNKYLSSDSELQAGLISIDSSNGFVKAIVGGKNYIKGDFNRALYSKRQPGSSFKPVVYLAALQDNIPMNTVIEDKMFSAGKWTPKNYGKDYKGNMTLLRALETSNNVIAVKLLQKVGLNKAIKIWSDLGFDTSDISKDYTYALGTITTTPLEMALLYASFSNGGYKVEPHFIYKIENRNGDVVYEAKTNRKKVFEKEDIALITHMLEKVVSNGTARSASVYKNGNLIPMAGKTGTTNGYVSAWFTGYTPNLSTAVYVGYDDNKSMKSGMTGSRTAIPIWKNYMQSIVNLPNYNVGQFDFILDGLLSGQLVQETIDVTNGLIDTDGVNAREALFKYGTQPLETESDNIFDYEY